MESEVPRVVTPKALRVNDVPLVSIVTPVYNGAEYLVECIESVIGQSYQNWEYLLVDNASTDLTPEIISRFADKDSRIKHLRFKEHIGAIDNHNRALKRFDSSSEFCKILQADDWLYPECLTKMVAAGLASETIGMVSAYYSLGHRGCIDGATVLHSPCRGQGYPSAMPPW